MTDAGRRTWQWWTSALHISAIAAQSRYNSLLLYFVYPKSPRTSSLHLALYHFLFQFKYSWAHPGLNEELSEGVSFNPFSLFLPGFYTTEVVGRISPRALRRGKCFPICTDDCSRLSPPSRTPGRTRATFRMCVRQNNNQIQWYAANYSCNSWKAVTFTYK